MPQAPEKIWATGWFLDPTCRWWSDKRLGENAAQTEFVRADLCADPALLAEAVEVLRECHDALRDHGKQYPHMIKGYTLDAETRARAFLAKLENRHE